MLFSRSSIPHPKTLISIKLPPARRGIAIEIYVEGDAPDHLNAATEDLARALGKATGREVRTLRAPEDALAGGIWVGRTAAAQPFEARAAELRENGYLLWGDGSRLVIWGRTSHGTVNGIYSYLRRFLLARWFAPGPLFEFVPRAEHFVLPKIDESSNPGFELRMYSGLDAEWATRNRMDKGRRGLRLFSMSHNLMNLLPSSELADKHPELYALIDGRRMTEQTSHRGQPCFSNSLTAEIAIERIRRQFDADKDLPAISISVNDNMDFCRCEECARFGVRQFRGRPIYSNAYFHWVNEVATEVLRSHPDRLLGALAYWGVILPPEQIERLPENLVIYLTQDTSQYHDAAYKATDRAILTDWLARCSHLVKYDYYGLGWLTPRYYPRLASEDLEFLSKRGVSGFYCEAYPFWPNIAPQLYMAAQKMWNPGRDCDELLNEFFAFFSPVSEEIESFYSVLESSWLRKRKGTWFEGLGRISDELQVMTLEEANMARDCLRRAREASSGNCRKRVEFLMDGFELSYQLIRGFRTSSELRFLPVSEKSDIEGAMPLLLDVEECPLEFYRIHRDRIDPDGLYSDVYYRDRRFQRKYAAWRAMLSSSCLVWLEKAGESLGHDPEAWGDLMARLPDAVANLAKMVNNPKARDIGGSLKEGPKPAPAAGRPRKGRWQLYAGSLACEPDDALSHSGGGSMRFEGRGRSRLTRYFPAKGSRSYLVGAWVYADRVERRRSPSMDVTFLDRLASEPGELASMDLVQTSGEWQRLLVLARAPEDASLMGVHFVLEDEEDRVWIDDVTISEIP